MNNLIKLLKEKLPPNYQLLFEVEDYCLILTLKHWRPSSNITIKEFISFEQLELTPELLIFTVDKVLLEFEHQINQPKWTQ